jgi:hypothetical protein
MGCTGTTVFYIKITISWILEAAIMHIWSVLTVDHVLGTPGKYTAHPAES